MSRATDVVTVIVGSGDDAKMFGIHAHLLQKGSRFFAAALKGDWKEAHTRTVRLPEDDPEVFEVYASWLYEKCLSTQVKNEDAAPLAEETMLIRAYVHGHKYGDDTFCDAVIDTLRQACNSIDVFSRYGDCANIYNNTSEGSMLRKLVIDRWLHCGHEPWIEVTPAEKALLPREFLWEYMCAAVCALGKELQLTPSNAPWLTDKCAYHLHKKTGGPCYLTHSDLAKHDAET